MTAVQDSLKAELMNVTAASQATHAELLAERQVLTEQLAEGVCELQHGSAGWSSHYWLMWIGHLQWVFTKPASFQYSFMSQIDSLRAYRYEVSVCDSAHACVHSQTGTKLAGTTSCSSE